MSGWVRVLELDAEAREERLADRVWYWAAGVWAGCVVFTSDTIELEVQGDELLLIIGHWDSEDQRWEQIWKKLQRPLSDFEGPIR